MVRYVRQTNNYNCGPIALINIIKWAGGCVTVKHNLDEYIEWCNCTSYVGVLRESFDECIKEIEGIVIKKQVEKPPTSEIDEHLDSGGAVVLDYVGSSEESGHITLIIGRREGRYIFVNDDGEFKKTILERTKEELEELINQDKYLLGEYYISYCWFIEKAGVVERDTQRFQKPPGH